MQLVHIAHSILIVIVAASSSQDNNDDDNENPCLLYLAQSTIPHAGLGMFTGTSLKKGQLIGRVGGEFHFVVFLQSLHLFDYPR
eukprot:scaffold228017_cov36-Cyclotella_meneghiniana.AAC.1